MKTYVIRRLISLVPVLLGITLLSFSLLKLVPGDICTIILRNSPTGSAEEFTKCRQQLGLDDPAPQQFIRWLGNAVRGDFGDSYWTHRPIVDEVAKRAPISIELAVLAVLMSTVLGISVGVISATRQDSLADYVGRVFTIIGLSIPDFVIGTVLLLVLVFQFEWVPPITYRRLSEDPWGNFQQFIFPAVLLGFGLSASIARMTRSTMLEVLRQDYIRTAWAKGMQTRVVIMRHALRNGFIPVLTFLALQLSNLLGGSVIIENSLHNR